MQCFILVMALILDYKQDTTSAKVISLILFISFNMYSIAFIFIYVLDGLPYEYIDWIA